MNLDRLIQSGPQPRVIRRALLPRFGAVDVERKPQDSVCPFQIVARDDAGRIRLRIPYFWSERLDQWLYFICPGEPAHG